MIMIRLIGIWTTNYSRYRIGKCMVTIIGLVDPKLR